MEKSVFIFVGQFANAPAPGSQVRIQSWLLASLLWEAGDRKVRAEPLSPAGTISSTHDFGCPCNKTFGATNIELECLALTNM